MVYQLQFPAQNIEMGGLAPVFQVFENKFPARDGVAVLRSLAGGVRIVNGFLFGHSGHGGCIYGKGVYTC